MIPDTLDDNPASAPFEGPEKLLEVWFAPSGDTLHDMTPSATGKRGLRMVGRRVWEDMLATVKCKVLSCVEGIDMDAYLLSESSLLVAPHRLILKTCGTTLNLLGLPRILEIAAAEANLPFVYRCFYSRKAFMFPDRQLGPHREWKHEIAFLDCIFDNGAAYTVGNVNGDHWLLYMTDPGFQQCTGDAAALEKGANLHCPDYTMEILMSELSPLACQSFYTSATDDGDHPPSPSARAQELSKALGISDIFPSHLTDLDAYSFTPCGYSANALVRWDTDLLSTEGLRPLNTAGEGYYSIHVTPEDGGSYASFECNVPPFTTPASKISNNIPDLITLIRRVVNIFQPGRLTLTLFISSNDNETDADAMAAEKAQQAFKKALSTPQSCDTPRVYGRTDKINYEFSGYELAFASFVMK